MSIINTNRIRKSEKLSTPRVKVVKPLTEYEVAKREAQDLLKQEQEERDAEMIRNQIKSGVIRQKRTNLTLVKGGF